MDPVASLIQRPSLHYDECVLGPDGAARVCNSYFSILLPLFSPTFFHFRTDFFSLPCSEFGHQTDEC